MFVSKEQQTNTTLNNTNNESRGWIGDSKPTQMNNNSTNQDIKSVPEYSSALIGWVKGEEFVETVLLLTPTPMATIPLPVLVSEGKEAGFLILTVSGVDISTLTSSFIFPSTLSSSTCCLVSAFRSSLFTSACSCVCLLPSLLLLSSFNTSSIPKSISSLS
ncbi:hypothetical protein E2C01_036640 [Portunus trituberculatus]|uniref:Uncharacterized protein n=1 Tax=Portunus trituberculatus TaxID=210409 RepID=A0A5B7FBX7_PORTR|nr:hypothetical protein [Portunus trituberculatus]